MLVRKIFIAIPGNSVTVLEVELEGAEMVDNLRDNLNCDDGRQCTMLVIVNPNSHKPSSNRPNRHHLGMANVLSKY